MPAAAPPAAGEQPKETDMQRVKKILLWVLVAFGAYAIFTSPDRAADMVKTAGDICVDGVKSIGTFFDALLS